MSPNSNNNANRQMMKTKLKLHSDSKDNQSFDEGNNHAVNSLHRKHQNLQTNNFGKNQAPIDLNLQSIKDKLNKELRKVQKKQEQDDLDERIQTPQNNAFKISHFFDKN